MTHPGQENQPARPAEPTRAVQLPPVPQPGGPQAGPAGPPPEQPYQSWGPGQPGQPQQAYAPQGGPPPQQPYLPQGGQPGQPPYQQWGPGQAPPPGPVVVPKSGRAKWISIGGGLLVAALVAIGVFLFNGSKEPSVGDCIKESGDSFDVVDCDASDAQYKVLGVDGQEQTFEEASADLAGLCQDFPDATYAAWYGDEGGDGKVYCAGPVG